MSLHSRKCLKNEAGRCWRCHQSPDTWAGKPFTALQGCFAVKLQKMSTVPFLPFPQAWTGPDFSALWHQQEKSISVLHSWCYTHLNSTFVQRSKITFLSWGESQLKTTKCIKLFPDVAVNDCQIFVEIKNTFVCCFYRLSIGDILLI